MSKDSSKGGVRGDDLPLDEDGFPVLDLTGVESGARGASSETAIPIPKWGWWLLLVVDALLIVGSVMLPQQGLVLGGLALAIAVFISRYGKDTLLENYERRVQERYGDRPELTPEQQREIRTAIAEAQREQREEKRLERAAKRAAKREGREYEEVLAEMRAEKKAGEAAADASEGAAAEAPAEAPDDAGAGESEADEG